MKNALLAGLLCTSALTFPAIQASAQCPAGKLSVTISVTTDLYPDETYWELVPGNNPCGNGTILWGGNQTQVGCNGGGAGTSTSGNGYPNANSVYTSNAVCLDSGSNYTIRSVDSYSDGGAKFTVNIAGLPLYNFHEKAANTAFGFTAKPALPIDMGVRSLDLPLYETNATIVIKGSIFSYSKNTITSLRLNYQVDNQPVVSETITGLNIDPYTAYSFSLSTPWVPTVKAAYVVKAWADQINGSADMNTANDVLEKRVVIGDGIPNVLDHFYRNQPPAFQVIANSSNSIAAPTDLDFHPVLSNYELWVTNRSTEAIGGSTVTIYNAGNSGQKAVLKKDANSWHFMSLPTGIAFSENGNFATSPGVQDANHSGGSYTGPSLWTSDTNVYAKPSGGNGSHLDMLHESPFSMGIAAESGNAFWVFDGFHQRISRFDFVEDHGPGADDHSDGTVRCYQDFLVKRVDDLVPNHLVLDKATKWLYCVDNGNKRVVRLKINTGTVSGQFAPMEAIAETSVITGATWEAIITNLNKPCGIEVVGDRLLVGDYATGEITVYDISVTPVAEVYRIATNPGLMGIKVGPDGKIWYVNHTMSQVVKLEPANAGFAEMEPISGMQVYPNPAAHKATVNWAMNSTETVYIAVTDLQGRTINTMRVNAQPGSNQVSLELDRSIYPAGMYLVRMTAGSASRTCKLVVN